MVGEVVVGVLVRDHHGVRAVDGLGLGEAAGVDDEGVAVVLDADAGVAELRDAHAPSLGGSSSAATPLPTTIRPCSRWSSPVSSPAGPSPSRSAPSVHCSSP